MNKYKDFFKQEVKVTRPLENILTGVCFAFETTDEKIVEYKRSWWGNFEIQKFDSHKDYVEYLGWSDEDIEENDTNNYFDKEIMDIIKTLPNFKQLIVVIDA